MSKHTPGPWVLDDFEVSTERDPANLIAHVYACDRPENPDNEWDVGIETAANAKLIAAAPDLLEALEQIMVLVDASGSTPRPSVAKIIVAARAAIAKARGEE